MAPSTPTAEKGGRAHRPARRPRPGLRKKARGDALFPGAELTADELEFGRAMDAYKRDYRRPSPAWSEVLAVLKSLGYAKRQ
jgi:hypothetical protein